MQQKGSGGLTSSDCVTILNYDWKNYWSLLTIGKFLAFLPSETNSPFLTIVGYLLALTNYQQLTYVLLKTDIRLTSDNSDCDIY